MGGVTICHGVDLEVLLAPIALEVKKEMGQHILDNKLVVTNGQLLKLASNFNTYLTTTNM
jgi:hypothetical protein